MGEMRRRQKWKRNVFAGLIYFALLTGIIVVKEGARVYPGGGEVEILKDGWMWVQSDGTEVPVEVRDRVKIGKGEPLIIKNQIPEEGGHGMSLSFWSTMESVRVWADGELLYEYGTDTDVDRIWNHVYIPEDKAGKELIIEKICPYSIYAGQIRPVIWGYYPEIQYFLMNRYYPDYIIGQLLILFGVFLIAASLLMKSRHFPLKRGLYLGLFILLISVWICSETRIPVDYWGINSMRLSCTILMIVPIVYLLFIRELTEGSTRRDYHIVLSIACINAAGGILVTLLGLADIVDTLYPTHIVIFLIAGFIAYSWGKEWKRTKRYKDGSWYNVIEFLGTVGMIVSIIAEGIIFYVDEYRSTGTYVQSALILYILILTVSFFKDAAIQADQADMFARELEESRMKMMISQIRPHFLYNTLLAIQELCYTAPEKAADTIVTFADYLRSNMNFLKEEPLVPFERELKHVENYMEIQQVRFGRELKFTTDIRCKDFYVPPLSVQPIVENAVQHGIRGCPGGGIVRLVVENRDGRIYIITEDNGVGLDTNLLGKSEGFSAMENVGRRIEKLLNGEMAAESKIGMGTRITISFPYRKGRIDESNHSR